MPFDYDLFVIGAGPGGLAASQRAAASGAKVAIAEREKIGGTCVNRGCVPKKLMVYASRFPGIFQDAVGYGWSQSQADFNWNLLKQQLQQQLERDRQSYRQSLEAKGVTLIPGQAEFLDTQTLQINGQQVTASKILIAVGGRPAKPDIPGIELALTSRDMFQLPQLPSRIGIIGGGYVGVEFGSILRGLGSEVTLMDVRGCILENFDQDIQAQVQAGLSGRGMRILCNTTVERIKHDSEGFKLPLSGACHETLQVDTVLCATGRKPNLEPLNLEKVGVKADAHGILVDSQSCTSQPHIFAVGDCVTGLPELTPVAIARGRAFADVEFGQHPPAIADLLVPSAVYSEPEAATIGLTQAQATEQLGDALQCYRSEFRPLYHSLSPRQERILLKLLVDQNTDQVVGAHMVGESAAEIIQSLTVAITMGATKKDFDAAISLHPTIAEEFFTLE